ncbi:MAG TPA: alginate lyase family protein [Gaiellaceae bacterium]|nr:alginate lyase family protein [Gaiellaceae bacterium]
MAPRTLKLARKALQKPPRVVLRRAWTEAVVRTERRRGPARARALDEHALLHALEDHSLDAAWERLRSRPFLLPDVDRDELEAAAPGEAARALAAAARAHRRELDLLGTGALRLGTPADWHTDVKTGTTWPPAWWRELDYAQLDRPSDVKVPWEISRLQWLLPLGQAHLLDRDERHAAAARDVLEEWIEANPYGESVNWASPMEAALRILTFTWLFHALAGAEAWRDPSFRFRFLRAVYLHGDFVARNLELSDVNGNHLDADAAGLVFAGLFFGSGRAPARWGRTGWSLLLRELPRQVTPDGVDFEMSTAYHRLVTELFLLPALLRRAHGLDVPAWYLDRLEAMARFAAAYTRPDGSSPVWGDADDARALPLGSQALGDHRYLGTLVAAGWGAEVPVAGPRSEAAWLFGPAAASALQDGNPPGSTLFAEGGCAVLRSGGDHVFVDCGPVGLAGRGGHGHNDCLAFEAALDGVPLLVDCGSYVYTGSVEWRNRFRSTAFHNTPAVDGEEQNRFHEPPNLWLLRYEAVPEVRAWIGDPEPRLVAAHQGYASLSSPVIPVRTITLEPGMHRLVIHDVFEGAGEHDVVVPYHLAPGVFAELAAGAALLRAEGQTFSLVWDDATEWEATTEEAWFSPSYGVRHPILRVAFRRTGQLRPLTVSVEPRP